MKTKEARIDTAATHPKQSNGSYAKATRCRITGCTGVPWRSTGGLCMRHFRDHSQEDQQRMTEENRPKETTAAPAKKTRRSPVPEVRFRAILKASSSINEAAEKMGLHPSGVGVRARRLGIKPGQIGPIEPIRSTEAINRPLPRRPTLPAPQAEPMVVPPAVKAQVHLRTARRLLPNQPESVAALTFIDAALDALEGKGTTP